MCNLLKNEQDTVISDKKKEIEAMESLKMFGRSFTHEIRTPLSTISMICRLIKTELCANAFDKSKMLDRIEKINNEVKYLFVVADTINDRLCDIVGVEPFIKLSIKDVISDFLNEYKFSNLDAGLVKFDCVSDFFILVDKRSFTNVLCNFLRNALYDKNNSIEREVIITAYEEQRHNILSFKNNSFEVDKNICDSIFDPVMQKKFCGTNIGLYLCKKAMNEMGIKVFCELKSNRCIEFILQFPKL